MAIIRIAGMVDPHVHLRGMDWSHKATFASETAAALVGGYWTVLDMPNTPPTTTTRPNLDRKLTEFVAQAVCDWGVYFGASQHDNTTEYSQIMSAVCGLKIFNNATTGDLLLDNRDDRDAHYHAWSSVPYAKTISVHAEGETILDILELVRCYRQPTHFLHISTRKEIGYLRDAKSEGLPITIGVCPHHLFLTQNDISHLGSFGLMKPELKSTDDQNALWEAIREGIVDVIESDHAPHTIAEKESSKPPYGVPGLETTLPLMLQAVSDNRLTLHQLIPLISTNPQRIFGLTCPPDTYTVVDIDSPFIIERENLRTHCGWSPFEGMRVRGKVREVWIRGVRVFDGDNICVQQGFGKNLYA